MIGKILTISDASGQVYVDDARETWHQYGFVVVDMNIEAALQIRDFDSFYMIALTMCEDNYALYLSYISLLRNITNIPIVLFPLDNGNTSTIVSSEHNGADQTIALPVDMEWAITNCIALMRRYMLEGPKPLQPHTLYADHRIFLDIGRYSAHVDGREIELHKKEFLILRLLMEHRGHILTYEQIYSEVWGYEYSDSPGDMLWAHIKNLRRKLQWKPDLPQYIRTKRGVGYSFSPRPNVA